MADGLFPTIARSKLTFLVLLLVLAGLLLRNRTFFEPPYEDHYSACASLLAQARELAERNAGAADWSALKQSSREQLAPIAAVLEPLCKRHPVVGQTLSGTAVPDRMTLLIRQPLLQIARDGLPQVLANGAAGKPLEEAHVESQLATVRKALDGLRLGPAPAGQ